MNQGNMGFGEALAYLEQGAKITNETGRVYAKEGNDIVCYANPINNPDHRYVVTKFFVDAIMSKQWRLL